MTDKEIQQIWKIIIDNYNKYLKDKHIKLPSLKDGSGKYTKNALVLIRLAKNYPNTKVVSKTELTNFIRNFILIQ